MILDQESDGRKSLKMRILVVQLAINIHTETTSCLCCCLREELKAESQIKRPDLVIGRYRKSGTNVSSSFLRRLRSAANVASKLINNR